MTALTSGWMLVTERYQHTWTEGKNYKIRDNGDKILITSDAGEEKLRREDCDPDMLLTVFGMRI